MSRCPVNSIPVCADKHTLPPSPSHDFRGVIHESGLTSRLSCLLHIFIVLETRLSGHGDQINRYRCQTEPWVHNPSSPQASLEKWMSRMKHTFEVLDHYSKYSLSPSSPAWSGVPLPRYRLMTMSSRLSSYIHTRSVLSPRASNP